MNFVTIERIDDPAVGHFPLSPETWRHVRRELDLPPQQIEYVRLLLSGYDGHRIADVMGISYATLRTYTARLQQKTHTRGQLDLVLTILRIVDRFRPERQAEYADGGNT